MDRKIAGFVLGYYTKGGKCHMSLHVDRDVWVAYAEDPCSMTSVRLAARRGKEFMLHTCSQVLDLKVDDADWSLRSTG